MAVAVRLVERPDPADSGESYVHRHDAIAGAAKVTGRALAQNTDGLFLARPDADVDNDRLRLVIR